MIMEIYKDVVMENNSKFTFVQVNRKTAKEIWDHSGEVIVVSKRDFLEITDDFFSNMYEENNNIAFPYLIVDDVNAFDKSVGRFKDRYCRHKNDYPIFFVYEFDLQDHAERSNDKSLERRKAKYHANKENTINVFYI